MLIATARRLGFGLRGYKPNSAQYAVGESGPSAIATHRGCHGETYYLTNRRYLTRICIEVGR